MCWKKPVAQRRTADQSATERKVGGESPWGISKHNEAEMCKRCMQCRSWLYKMRNTQLGTNSKSEGPGAKKGASELENKRAKAEAQRKAQANWKTNSKSEGRGAKKLEGASELENKRAKDEAQRKAQANSKSKGRGTKEGASKLENGLKERKPRRKDSASEMENGRTKPEAQIRASVLEKRKNERGVQENNTEVKDATDERHLLRLQRYRIIQKAGLPMKPGGNNRA